MEVGWGGGEEICKSISFINGLRGRGHEVFMNEMAINVR